MEYLAHSADRVAALCPGLSQFGLLSLPRHSLEPTAGLARHDRGLRPPPSICMLHQKGRCCAGDRCNQLHVDGAVWDDINERVGGIALAMCCVKHGSVVGLLDNAAFRAFVENCQVGVRMPDKQVFFFPANRVAYTQYWSNRFPLPKRGAHLVGWQRVCHLFAAGKCKLGTECKHMHLCCESCADIAAPPPRCKQAYPHPLPLLVATECDQDPDEDKILDILSDHLRTVSV